MTSSLIPAGLARNISVLWEGIGIQAAAAIVTNAECYDIAKQAPAGWPS